MTTHEILEKFKPAPAAHGDPVYPHELVAAIREMKEDRQMLRDFAANIKGGPHYDDWAAMMAKWESRIGGSTHLDPFLSAAPYLLKILKGKSE
jgi:hypothetical protein